MRKAFFIGIFLILFSALFAESYQTELVYDNWLKITRIVQTEKPLFCAGSYCSPNLSYGLKVTPGTTQVILRLENIGNLTRRNLTIYETLTYIPEGAKLSFETSPIYSSGREVRWTVEVFNKSEVKVFAYNFSAYLNSGNIDYIQFPKITIKPLNTFIQAPSTAYLNDTIFISVFTEDGKPLSDAQVSIIMPDGKSQILKTDKEGKISFSALKEGFYTYVLNKYNQTFFPSTKVKEKESSQPIAASTTTEKKEEQFNPLASLPIIIGIFIVFFMIFVLYNFLLSKKEEGESPQAEQTQIPKTEPETKDYQHTIQSYPTQPLQTQKPSESFEQTYVFESKKEEQVQEQKNQEKSSEEKPKETDESFEKTLAELEQIRKRFEEKEKILHKLEEQVQEQKKPKRILPQADKKLKIKAKKVKKK